MDVGNKQRNHFRLRCRLLFGIFHTQSNNVQKKQLAELNDFNFFDDDIFNWDVLEHA